ncbi:hypothetical protein [Allomesorhizobium camelthorni]|uniref:1-acyl-sn-glycerol-3-phosphate acyltransferase n=1 Tax=Allomesorhizobium camelthorni TaxID=475069 RepID=A0A6G4WF47_9HYPH|nr:hypothetical protein [Mesorhizobium camelthorni]NGO53412.1 hypothetical protein [Mesorhizobium camelthorni]
MSRLDTFVAPEPSVPLIKAMTVVNRVLMLRGVLGFRDIPPFNRIAGLRGIANVRHIDFPEADRARLAGVCGQGKATFITPNHPEFFTDWMIDKEIASHACPLAAFWATNGVVNGLGKAAQKFWLANNLIAQIPGNSQAARELSVSWALKGHGVLLHPEGSVGWHGDFVAPLMPGAAEMALEALKRSREAGRELEVWIAPIVWKLAFTRNVEADLMKECAYVERSLKIEPAPRSVALPDRVYRIYETLLSRDEEKHGVESDGRAPFADRQEALLSAMHDRLCELLPETASPASRGEIMRNARRFLRENSADPELRKQVKSLSDAISCVQRVGDFAFASKTVTQEGIAEHIKRIRNDYCKGTMRDTLNRFLPQPAGPRRAHIRAPEPLAMHDFQGAPGEAMAEIRRRMQAALDEINDGLRASGSLRFYPNPFHHSRNPGLAR